MRSPLPDSATLEAGLFEDQPPSRLSRVQNNVRNLLRSSNLISANTSPLASPTEPRQSCAENHPRSQLNPTLPREDAGQSLPLPTSASSHSDLCASRDTPGILFTPLAHHQRAPRDGVPQSSLSNTPRDALFVHPDMSDSSIAALLQQKKENRQQRAWKRSRHQKKHHRSHRNGISRWALCVVSGLLLIAIVATCKFSSRRSVRTEREGEADKHCRSRAFHGLDGNLVNLPCSIRTWHSDVHDCLCALASASVHFQAPWQIEHPTHRSAFQRPSQTSPTPAPSTPLSAE